MMENISAIANINHMGGQSHLLTLVTKSIDTTSISYHLYAAEGETSPGFAYKNGHPSSSWWDLLSRPMTRHCVVTVIDS